MKRLIGLMAILGMFSILAGCGSAKKDPEAERLRSSIRAQELLKHGKPKEGVPLAQKAVAMTGKAFGKDSVEAGIETLNLVECHIAARQQDEAKIQLEKAISTLDNLQKVSPGVLNGYLHAANLQQKMGNQEGAVACLKQVISRAEQGNADHVKLLVSSRRRLGQMALQGDNYPAAVREFGEALKVAEGKAGYSALREARIMTDLCLANILAKDCEKGVKYGEKAIELMGDREFENPMYGEAWNYLRMARMALKNQEKLEPEIELERLQIICEILSNYSLDRHALPFARKMLELAIARDGPFSILAIIANFAVGDSLAERDELDEAKKALLDTEKRLDESKMTGELVADHYLKIAVTFEAMEAHEEGIKASDKALKLYRENGGEGRQGMVRSFVTQGRSYLKLKKLPQARESFENGLAILEKEEIEDALSKVFGRKGLGDVHLAMGEFLPALENYTVALEVARENAVNRADSVQMIQEGIAQAREGLEKK